MSGGWAWAGAKAAGTSHIEQRIPCQDAFTCRVCRSDQDGPIFIAALADGAGSADRSEIGAELATSLVAEIISQAFDDDETMASADEIVRYAITETRLIIQLKADHDGRPVSDYASTLLVAVLAPSLGIIGQIGDGAVVIDDGAGAWHPVHWPDHGEYANTTSFLTQEDALDMLQIANLNRPVRRVALFSDGLERLVLNFRKRSAHAPFFDSVFQCLQPSMGIGDVGQVSADLGDLLKSDTVNSRTDDDKCLVCASLLEV